MVVPEKGLRKCALSLLPYLTFDGSTSLHTVLDNFLKFSITDIEANCKGRKNHHPGEVVHCLMRTAMERKLQANFL